MFSLLVFCPKPILKVFLLPQKRKSRVEIGKPNRFFGGKCSKMQYKKPETTHWAHSVRCRERGCVIRKKIALPVPLERESREYQLPRECENISAKPVRNTGKVACLHSQAEEIILSFAFSILRRRSSLFLNLAPFLVFRYLEFFQRYSILRIILCNR